MKGIKMRCRGYKQCYGGCA